MLHHLQEARIPKDPLCSHMNYMTIDSADDVKQPLIDVGTEPCVTYLIEVKVINKVGITPGTPVTATNFGAGKFADTNMPVSISIRHQSVMKVSYGCLSDINPGIFTIWKWDTSLLYSDVLVQGDFIHRFWFLIGMVYQWIKMIRNANRLSCFLKWVCHNKGLWYVYSNQLVCLCFWGVHSMHLQNNFRT